MINEETILSVYTDKQTLLEYLTKIETALDKAVLTSSQLVYEGANNYHFKFVFEDGSSIETPSITLVQPISKVDFLANGNSVHFVFTLMDGETITTQTINLLKPVTAAAVRDGILYLTLSDGTEVNAGSVTASFGATTFNGDVLVKGNFNQTDGNAILGGNAEVDGNCSINGILTQGTFELDKEISVSSLPNNLNCNYAHARISNGKLNVVVALWAESGVTIPANQLYFGAVPLSDSILAKLYPFKGTALDRKTILGGCTPVVSTNPVQMLIYKETSGVRMDIANPAITTTSLTSWRFEFNFILS